MYDFCFTPFYAAIVAAGGLFGYFSKGSVASLVGGGISAILLSLFAYMSYSYYTGGKTCKSAVSLSLIVSFAMAVMMYQRYTETGTYYTATMAAISTAMSFYYIYNLMFIRVKRSAARRGPVRRY